jgi:hypothetical protein
VYDRKLFFKRICRNALKNGGEEDHPTIPDDMAMRAYAPSPPRGLIFGGVTRHMLAWADLPALMRHE